MSSTNFSPVVPKPINVGDYFYNQDTWPELGVKIRRVYKFTGEDKEPVKISKFTYKLKR